MGKSTYPITNLEMVGVYPHRSLLKNKTEGFKMIYGVLFLLMLLNSASIEAQDKFPIRVSVKAQPLYEVSTTYFSFLDGVKYYYEYYGEFYAREMRELESKLKTSGVVLHNYVFDVNYKSFALFLGVSTSKISPFFIRGYHRAEGYYIVGKLQRNTHNFSIGFKYNWKVLSLHLGYEYNIESISSVGVRFSNFGWALLSGGYRIGALTTGGGFKVRLGQFKISQDLTTSILGNLNYSFGMQDTAASEHRILYIHKYRYFHGGVSVLSYAAELGYEHNKVGITLLYAYNFTKSRDIFKRAIHRFGVGLKLKLL